MTPTGGTMAASVPMFYRIKALGSEPTNMVYIPAGWFDMGNCMGSGEGVSSELPVHSVYVSGFYMDQYEVSKSLWDEVYAWATNNSYDLTVHAFGKSTNHPVVLVNWYNCVKWANARSEKEGLTPCYYVSPATTTVYRTGDLSLSNECVRWGADGYRLPAEAEWEKAARGGASGHRFPWADDTISHGRANYNADNYYSYDLSYPTGYHPDYETGSKPYTCPAGTFAGNGYGLYDMSGNVSEWCWDWFDYWYYTNSPSTNPRGPASGSRRVTGGGSWTSASSNSRVANRTSASQTVVHNALGFRLVRVLH